MSTPFSYLLCLLAVCSTAFAQPTTITVNSGKFQTAVVELYTSEGCSSCPPADRWLTQLTRVPHHELDTLALSFHVDYWDYIGWKDEFANPRYTERQRRLALLNRQSSIYTPEFFVDGQEARGTLNILEKIRNSNKTASKIDLSLTVAQHPDQLLLNLNSQNHSKQALHVQFVVFENALSNQVDKGENAGRTLNHQRVVRYLSTDRAVTPTLSHQIPIQADWKQQNLGVGAIITSPDQEYIQAVFTLLSSAL